MPKAGPGDVAEAAHCYQSGESFAAIWTALGANPATAQREENQAGVSIRKRRR